MKVLMFGWEFPPFNSGGLGTACQGLVKGLANNEVEVTFVMPAIHGALDGAAKKFVDASQISGAIRNLKIKTVDSLLAPYLTSLSYDERVKKIAEIMKKPQQYGSTIYDEAKRYAEAAKLVALTEDFDVIHCHDWMTYEAGIAAKKISGKPLVCHIHATEFDRTGGTNNQYIYDLERRGFHEADKVIAVSNYTKGKVCYHYGVPDSKVAVVHNAVEFTNTPLTAEEHAIKKYFKVVLFLGRVTIQKGPDWFLYAARKVLDKDPNVKFIFAGNGDMEQFCIEKAAELGIGHNVLFAGLLRGPSIDRAYRMADLYVMPSISEPFGITPLEALRNGTPILISKQSVVSEVVENAIKVNFWDIDEMADEILDVLHNPERYARLRDNGRAEVMKFNWNEPAWKCKQVYEEVVRAEAW